VKDGKTIRVRNKRDPGYYQIDTVFIKGGWARALGPYSLAVYNALACFADNDTQSAYPSYQTIADLIGCSRRKVVDAITELEKYNLIARHKRYNHQGQTSNLIELLHRDEWLPPTDAKPVSAPPAPLESASPAPSRGASPAPELSPDSLSSPNLKQGGADAPPTPPSEKSKSTAKKRKTRTPKHSSIETYRRATGRYPPKATEPLIVGAGIETENDLQFWENVIRHYIACGWSPQNISGMLDFFKRRELPSTRPTNKTLGGGYQNERTYEQPSRRARGNTLSAEQREKFGIK
jgi:hypothetical protein